MISQGSSMHITMVKKRLADGSECRKCQEASEHLHSRGLWERIDEVVWAHEGDAASPGVQLGSQLGIDRAPFFVVKDPDGGQAVYVSVLQLVRERLGQAVTVREQVQAIDPDDIGGI
jgi:hypothetical protein